MNGRRTNAVNSSNSTKQNWNFRLCICAYTPLLHQWVGCIWVESFSLKCEFENCVLLFKCTACDASYPKLCYFWVACSFIWAHTTAAANTTIINVVEREKRNSNSNRSNSNSSWNFGTISPVQTLFASVCQMPTTCLKTHSPHLHTHAAHDLQ